MKMRVTARFYLLLIVIALLIVYLFRGAIFGTSEVAVIMPGSASEGRRVQALIVRDETVVSNKQVTRIIYNADECTQVHENEKVALVYTNTRAIKTIGDLNTSRQNIQAYHKILLGNEIDAQLETHNLTVLQRAAEFKDIATSEGRGNLLGVVKLLRTAMDERRSYLQANKRSDPKLNKYYGDEETHLKNLSGWQVELKAPFEGLVSFYMDGYEQALNADTVMDLTIEDMQAVLEGKKLDTGTVSRAITNVFRIAHQDHWYILLLDVEGEWNPILDQQYSFRMDGYTDLVYTGTVVKVTKSGRRVMATLEITDPVSSLFYTRTGDVTIGTDMSGLAVSKKAISNQSGQTGVWLYDVPGGTFIPIEVLTTKKDGTVLFVPLVDGVLNAGAQVLIK